MCIDHSLHNISVTEYFLQSQDVATVHYKMIGERMPQNMNGLPFWQFRGLLV